MRRTLKHNTPFRSPITQGTGTPAGRLHQSVSTTSPETQDVTALQEKLQAVKAEIQTLENEGCKESELKVHIDRLHEYNEIKDVAQMVLGRLATIEGVCTKDLYEKYGLGLTD